MHAATLFLAGDPDALLPRDAAMVAEAGPSSPIHACLRGPDGLLVVDTCPSERAVIDFRDGPWLADALARHGLPQPEMHDDPVHRADAGGTRVDGG